MPAPTTKTESLNPDLDLSFSVPVAEFLNISLTPFSTRNCLARGSRVLNRSDLCGRMAGRSVG